MRNLFAICLSALLLTVSPVQAEDAGRDTICRLLPQHKPATGVEYKAGVDVHGNPVVGADLGVPLKPLDGPAVVIPVDINLASRFNVALPAGVELKPAIAALKIHADGRVEYNGQDISEQVHTMCGQQQPQDAAAPPAVIAQSPEPQPVHAPPAAEPESKEEIVWEVQGPPAPLLLHPDVPSASRGQNL